jgi:hypothetical protein
VLPANLSGFTSKLNSVPVESIGWPQFVATVDHAWYQLPAAQRANAVIFTGNYGEAGAISELGRADRLPDAVSGQNTVWWWGPGNPRATTVLAVVQPGYPQQSPCCAATSPMSELSLPSATPRTSATRKREHTSGCAPDRSSPGERSGLPSATTAEQDARGRPGKLLAAGQTRDVVNRQHWPSGWSGR